MEGEIITTLADKGAIGVVILSIVAIVFLVRVFLKHMGEQSSLSRKTLTETTAVMAGALKEVTEVVREMHINAKTDHAIIKEDSKRVLGELGEVKTLVIANKH